MTLLLLTLLLPLVPEDVLGDLHPKFLSDLFVLGLVGVLLRHLDILALQSNFDGLVEVIQNGVDDYLRLLHRCHFCFELRDLILVALHEVVVILLPGLLVQLGRHSFQVQALLVLLLFLLANIEGIVNFKINRMSLGLLDLLALQEADHSLRVICLGVEEESHIVHNLRSTSSPDDAVIRNVIQSNFLVLLMLDVHESRHQLRNVYFSELLSLQLLDRRLGALVQKDRSVLKHGLISLHFVFDLRHLLEGLLVLLFIDVVDYDSVVSFDDLRILDALINLAVALQNLEDGLHVLAVFGLAQELSEALQLLSVLLAHFFLLFLCEPVVVSSSQNRIQLIELQFYYPGAKQKLLWLL